MIKEAILAGLGGGIILGIIQSLTMGPARGVFMGLFFGVGVGLFIHRFANSKMVKQQTSVPQSALLPGERLLLSKPANLIIEPKQFALQNFAFGDLLWAVGMKNKESLGGALHLTNYRIIFKSHRFNRLRGMTSIFLPTIQQLENRTVLIFRKLRVSTVTARVALVVGQVDEVIQQIVAAREQMDEATLATLKNHATNHPDRCSDGLQPWDAINKLNDLVNLGKKATSAARVFSNPLGALGSIFIGELLDKSLADKWQQIYHAAERHHRFSWHAKIKRRSKSENVR